MSAEIRPIPLWYPRGTRERFLPPRVAAGVMGLSVDELLSLVQRGLLEAEDVGERELWVRPAVVSVLGVDDVR